VANVVEALEGRRMLAFSSDVVLRLTGRSGNEVVVTDVQSDRDGHVYVSGGFDGVVDFDPRRNHNFELVNQRVGEPKDAFVAKYTADGRLLWVRQLQVTGESPDGRGEVGRMAVNANGDVALTGRFTGTTDFNPRRGRALMTATDARDVFVWKLNADGWYQWAQTVENFRPSPINGHGNAVAFDAAGDVVATGEFLSAGDETNGAAFVARLAGSSGEVAYVKDPSLFATRGVALAADREGFVYVAGQQTGSEQDGFVAKVNRRGNTVWYRTLGDTGGLGEAARGARGVAVARAGAVYVTGRFSGEGSFGGAMRTSVGLFDGYLAKYDATGDVTWVRSWGGAGETVYGEDVALDNDERVYVAGRFTGVVDFNPGGGTAQRDGSGSLDFYLSRFDAAGAFSTATSFGGKRGRFTEESRVVASRSGDLFVGGTFGGVVELDPGASPGVYDSAGDIDGFWARLAEE
jgi:hypothetical protein